ENRGAFFSSPNLHFSPPLLKFALNTRKTYSNQPLPVSSARYIRGRVVMDSSLSLKVIWEERAGSLLLLTRYVITQSLALTLSIMGTHVPVPTRRSNWLLLVLCL